MDPLQVDPDLPRWAEQMWHVPARFKVGKGGRGGSKSWTFARMAVMRSMEKKRRILCTREIQNSIKDSVHKLLVEQIDLLKLKDWFIITDHELRCANGSNFIFTGLAHQGGRGIKSLEGIDIAWVEEGEKVSKDSWKNLTPTIRKEGSEIWCSFNPDLEDDETYQKFVVNTPPRMLLAHVGWRDNPWFPNELLEEMIYCRDVDYESYLNIWEGEPRAHGQAQVFSGKWQEGTFEISVDPDSGQFLLNGMPVDGPYYGLDFGFSVDPTAGVRLWIQDGVLYIEREFYKLRLDINDHKKVIEDALELHDLEAQIFADSARPETISHLRNEGLNVQGVEKWKGSVEDGVTVLRKFRRIIIHPRCKHMIDEAKFYKYKVDKNTGLVTTEIVDKFNHLWDAIRYALSRYIKRTGRGRGFVEHAKQEVKEAENHA